MADRGSLRADIADVVTRFAELLALPESQAALLALFAEGSRDPQLRQRIREHIVDPQKRLVHEGLANAAARGEIQADGDAGEIAEQIDIIFDTIAGAVEHRMLVIGEPADSAWIERFIALLLNPGLISGC
jgi:hypothetical protein